MDQGPRKKAWASIGEVRPGTARRALMWFVSVEPMKSRRPIVAKDTDWMEWRHPRQRQLARAEYEANKDKPKICEACGESILNDGDRISGDACDYHRWCVTDIID